MSYICHTDEPASCKKDVCCDKSFADDSNLPDGPAFFKKNGPVKQLFLPVMQIVQIREIHTK